MRRPVPVGPPARGRTGAFERLARIPDHRLVDRVIRGRACIWMIGILLGGIVAMQVSLLRLNTGISRAVATQGTLERQNATLQSEIAKYSSGDKIRTGALKENMIDPPAGETRFLTARDSDVPRAVRRYRPPSDAARGVMNNGGKALPDPATAVTLTAAPVTPIPTPIATPSALPTPVPTVAPAVTTPVPETTSPPLPTPAPTVTG